MAFSIMNPKDDDPDVLQSTNLWKYFQFELATAVPRVFHAVGPPAPHVDVRLVSTRITKQAFEKARQLYDTIKSTQGDPDAVYKLQSWLHTATLTGNISEGSFCYCPDNYHAAYFGIMAAYGRLISQVNVTTQGPLLKHVLAADSWSRSFTFGLDKSDGYLQVALMAYTYVYYVAAHFTYGVDSEFIVSSPAHVTTDKYVFGRDMRYVVQAIALIGMRPQMEASLVTDAEPHDIFRLTPAVRIAAKYLQKYNSGYRGPIKMYGAWMTAPLRHLVRVLVMAAFVNPSQADISRLEEWTATHIAYVDPKAFADMSSDMLIASTIRDFYDAGSTLQNDEVFFYAVDSSNRSTYQRVPKFTVWQDCYNYFFGGHFMRAPSFIIKPTQALCDLYMWSCVRTTLKDEPEYCRLARESLMLCEFHGDLDAPTDLVEFLRQNAHHMPLAHMVARAFDVFTDLSEDRPSFNAGWTKLLDGYAGTKANAEELLALPFSHAQQVVAEALAEELQSRFPDVRATALKLIRAVRDDTFGTIQGQDDARKIADELVPRLQLSRKSTFPDDFIAKRRDRSEVVVLDDDPPNVDAAVQRTLPGVVVNIEDSDDDFEVEVQRDGRTLNATQLLAGYEEAMADQRMVADYEETMADLQAANAADEIERILRDPQPQTRDRARSDALLRDRRVRRQRQQERIKAALADDSDFE